MHATVIFMSLPSSQEISGLENLLDPKNKLLARGPIARPDLFVLVRIEEPVPARPDHAGTNGTDPLRRIRQHNTIDSSVCHLREKIPVDSEPEGLVHVGRGSHVVVNRLSRLRRLRTTAQRRSGIL